MILEPDQVDSQEIALTHVAVAIRAGDEILGSIWAVVQQPIDTERIGTHVETAKVASLQLLRVRAAADIERRIVADLIATAMEAGPTGPEVLSKLGLLGRTLVVVALGVLRLRSNGESLDCEGLRQKIADALAPHMSAVAPGSTVGQLGDVAYCLLPVTGTVQTPRTRWARSHLTSSLELATSCRPSSASGQWPATPVSLVARAWGRPGPTSPDEQRPWRPSRDNLGGPQRRIAAGAR